MITAREVALAGLLRCCEPPAPAVIVEYARHRGPVDAWDGMVRRTAPRAVLSAVAARLGTADEDALCQQARADVEAAEAAGASIIGPSDTDWPADSFAALELVAPYDKCPAAAPPLALYRRGDAWPVDAHRAVSIVGSRAATPYGMRVAGEMAAAAAAAGIAVVSGAAFGIDVAAHRGALATQDLDGGGSGGTVAILACGIDRSYPAAHRAVLDAAAAAGAVVSEYPPGSVPARHRFLVRNRLIAAMAEVTVVVEAGRRSGSLNTATTAANLGRTVAAVPGPVTSAMSVGCHDLIRDHRAEIATGFDDVAGLLGPLTAAPPVHRRGSRPTDGLDLVTSRVHEALPTRRPGAVDEIAAEADLPVAEVLAGLSRLEVSGLARRRDGGWCIVT